MQLGASGLFFIENQLHCTVVGFIFSCFRMRTNAGTIFFVFAYVVDIKHVLLSALLRHALPRVKSAAHMKRHAHPTMMI